MKIYLDTSVIAAFFDDRNPERKALTEEFFSRYRENGKYTKKLNTC
jgi:predicted nucleic acid-binding protein